MLDQRVLQSKTCDGGTEQQRAIDVVALAGRPAQHGCSGFILGRVGELQQFLPGEQQADGQIHQEKQNQERFGAPEQFGRVSLHAPGEADTEGAEKADQVEDAPSLEPGDGKNAGVEQSEIAEQRNMAALSGRGQNRRRKTAERTSAGQGQRVLGQRQDGRETGDRDQQRKAEGGVQQSVQFHRGKNGQVQDANACTLQHQRVRTVAQAQPPAQPQQCQRTQRDAGVTRFNRHDHPFGGITQQKSQAEE